MMKKIHWATATLLLIALYGCSSQQVESDASGVFETTEVIVSSEASGTLLEWNITEGQTVEKGVQLGYIDTVQLALKKKQLETAAHASGLRRQDVPTQVAAIQEQIVKQKRELNRVDKLLKSGASTEKQRDDVASQLDILQKQLTAQSSILNNSNAAVSGEMDTWQVQIAQVEDQIRRCYINSPINGKILLKYVEQGELCMQGKPMFKVADLETVYLRAYIPAPLLTTVKLGQKAMVFADFGEKERKTYEGIVSWISDKAEFTPKTIQTRDERANLVYAVKIAVKNDGIIKIGMYGDVKFSEKTVEKN